MRLVLILHPRCVFEIDSLHDFAFIIVFSFFVLNKLLCDPPLVPYSCLQLQRAELHQEILKMLLRGVLQM